MTNDKKRLNLAVPNSLYNIIKDFASYRGKTINLSCVDILWEYFENKERQVKETEQAKREST